MQIGDLILCQGVGWANQFRGKLGIVLRHSGWEDAQIFWVWFPVLGYAAHAHENELNRALLCKATTNLV